MNTDSQIQTGSKRPGILWWVGFIFFGILLNSVNSAVSFGVEYFCFGVAWFGSISPIPGMAAGALAMIPLSIIGILLGSKLSKQHRPLAAVVIAIIGAVFCSFPVLNKFAILQHLEGGMTVTALQVLVVVCQILAGLTIAKRAKSAAGSVSS
jgi:hypothetical protein